MKYFNESFKTELQEVIAEIEEQSLVEIVGIVKPRSASYADVPLWWGLATLFATFSFLMFTHFLVGDDALYAYTLVSFFLGMSLPLAIKPLLRLFISKTVMARKVEIMARAFFQKAGIRHTQDEIGVLFYISYFERQVFILADRGAKSELPLEEWEAMEARFQTIFEADDPAKQFLTELRNTAATFAAYIPPVENDINELPDHIEVRL